ncbi:GyrI-like domain-containing protein [Haploplasma axanthum]|nr:GyrI-like domain-containing protein [Haploplasma axanthum]
MGISYQLEIKDFNAVRMVGKKTTVKFGGNAKKHWKSYLDNGDNDLLQNLKNKVSPNEDCIGWMGNSNLETKTFIEMPGVFLLENSDIPEGFDYIDIPKCKMAILWIEGDTPNLERGAHNHLLKYLKKTDYIEDYSLAFSMEYYTSIGYTHLNKENPVYKFGYLLPCRRRNV